VTRTWPYVFIIFSSAVIACTNVVLGLDIGDMTGFHIGGPLSLVGLWAYLRFVR
jgi:hypothetical protein